jgi:hypothetical protein
MESNTRSLHLAIKVKQSHLCESTSEHDSLKQKQKKLYLLQYSDLLH